MKFLRYLCFFPSITFGITSAEVFPYAMVFAASKMQRVKIIILGFIFLLSFSAIYLLITSGQNSITGEVLRSFLAYLNPLLIFAAILKLPEGQYQKFLKVNHRVFFILCGILVTQWSGLFSFMDPVIKALVPRASATPLGFRGITLLATEPARASIEFLFIYLVVRHFCIPQNLINIMDILITLTIAVIFKSATTLFLMPIFLLLFNRRLLLVILPISMYFILHNNGLVSGRAVDLIIQIFSMPLNDAIFLIINTSGNRVISIVASIQYGFQFPIGGGVGNWKETSIEALHLTGFDYSSLNYFNADWKEGTLYFRASGYMMNLMLDMGIIGVTAATMLLISLARPFIKGDKAKKNIFYFFMVNIYFVGSVGTPVAWIATALLLRSPKRQFVTAHNIPQPHRGQ